MNRVTGVTGRLNGKNKIGDLQGSEAVGIVDH
jgi:hypothetical protein